MQSIKGLTLSQKFPSSLFSLWCFLMPRASFKRVRWRRFIFSRDRVAVRKTAKLPSSDEKFVALTKQQGIADINKELDENNGEPLVQSFLSNIMVENRRLLEEEPSEALSIDECRDIIFGSFLAGLDTSSNSLGFTIHELAKNQDKQERLYQALVESGMPLNDPLNDPDILLQTLSCDYMKYVMNESLRLYPIAVGSWRQVVEDCMIGDYMLRKGESVLACAEMSHKVDAYWPSSREYPLKEFHPERWATEKQKKTTYQPFGIGQRDCAGQVFAKKEMSMVLALLLSRYRFELSDDPAHKLEKYPSMVITCASGFWVIPRARV